MINKFLKKNWKPLAIWSGVGGLFFGGAILAYKKGYVGNPNPAVPIPEDNPEITLRTCQFEVKISKGVHRVQSSYHLQRTPFKVWSVLDGRQAGHSIYFVTPTQKIVSPDGVEKLVQTDSFYAMIGIPRYFKRRDLLEHVRRDSQLVFQLCLVGGGPNGVPTGEKILSQGKLESWDFNLEEETADQRSPVK